MPEKLVDEFDVRRANGQIVRLYVFQKIIDARTKQNPHATMLGMKRVVTKEGLRVNFVDSETYEIVQSGEILKR